MDLYHSVATLTGDVGLFLHELMCAPALLWNEAQSVELVQRFDSNLHYLSNREMKEVQDDPLFLLRELPVNIQVFNLYYTLLYITKSIL